LPFFVPRYVRGDPGGGGDDSCNSDMDVGDDWQRTERKGILRRMMTKEDEKKYYKIEEI
jgi:hypothetical protein